jgi:hypothetical protein
MTPPLVLIALYQVLRLLLLSCRSSRSKDLELLVLRQDLPFSGARSPIRGSAFERGSNCQFVSDARR